MLDPVMSLCCRVANVTNERFDTIFKHWPSYRVHAAEVAWWDAKGYGCVPAGKNSTSAGYVTMIPD